MLKILNKLERSALSGKGISFKEAVKLLKIELDERLGYLFGLTNSVRTKFRKNIINLCAITNAKSGNCSQDCAFCSQSLHHNTEILTYPLISEDEIIQRARKAVEMKASRFCVVISGRGIESEDEIKIICNAFLKIKHEFPKLSLDASLGFISHEQAENLKASGLIRYNHNLETSESFFKNICSTHTYNDRLAMVKMLKSIGLEVCCGGIFGLGESPIQRVELAFALRQLNVNCIPINFLQPIDGTRLAGNVSLSPLELLKTVAIYRLILPTKEIRICGGRQSNLRSLQSLIFIAGADAIIIGDYLTTKGSLPDEDLKMIEDLGLKVNGSL